MILPLVEKLKTWVSGICSEFFAWYHLLHTNSWVFFICSARNNNNNNIRKHGDNYKAIPRLTKKYVLPEIWNMNISHSALMIRFVCLRCNYISRVGAFQTAPKVNKDVKDSILSAFSTPAGGARGMGPPPLLGVNSPFNSGPPNMVYIRICLYGFYSYFFGVLFSRPSSIF